MGCFDVVCAYTNTPIFDGERCHLIILPSKTPWSDVVWLAASETDWGANCYIFHGQYNDYGSIEPEGKPTKAYKKILDEFQDDEERKYFFVSDEAWQHCQEKYRSFVPQYIKQRREYRDGLAAAGATGNPRWDDPPNVEDIIALARVMMGFAHICKHPLSGLGCYHQYSGSEGEAIRAALALTEQRLQAREKLRQEDSE